MKHEANVTATVGHLIDGRIVHEQGRAQPVFNPATGASNTSVELASTATVERAIASAAAAFPAWRDTPPLKRARVMSRRPSRAGGEPLPLLGHEFLDPVLVDRNG